jgi:hypothetical protein
MKLVPLIAGCALLVGAATSASAGHITTPYVVAIERVGANVATGNGEFDRRGLSLVSSRTQGMTTVCGVAGMLGWLCHNAASGPAIWYAPICGTDKMQVLGRASESAMQGRFTFDPSTTREQRAYIEHWRALAAHCMHSPDNSCHESWQPPCLPKCDGAACKPIS